jgi:3-oxoacyl-[acyl-carrier protein] reductase
MNYNRLTINMLPNPLLYLTDDQRRKIYARTSLKAATSIESVAEIVAFLLFEKTESVTTQSIHVDKGTI